MIKSMTAFSQASGAIDDITAEVTIRSYNSRHLDFAFYRPESCQALEEDIKKIISATHKRGRVEVRISILDESSDQDLFEVDAVRAGSYYKALKQVQTSLSLKDEIKINHILSARHIIVPAKKKDNTEKIWAVLAKVVEDASNQLDSMRKAEGKNLYTDLMGRIRYIENNLKTIEKEAAAIPEAYKQKLMDRISRLTADTGVIDPVRITQEAAILADKGDVSEEIVRLYSHIKLFEQSMEAEESQGRKLNFLIQEFNREFNTIGSKAGNAVLSHLVVDLKSELEKIREQVQNVE